MPLPREMSGGQWWQLGLFTGWGNPSIGGRAARCEPRPNGCSGLRAVSVVARPAVRAACWCVDRWFRASASNRAGSPVMSHVIPMPIFQTLKCGCWNCNVCGLSRKMTGLNYVRN